MSGAHKLLGGSDMKVQGRTILAAYSVWAFSALAASFALRGPDRDNVTRVLIIAFFLAQLICFPTLSRLAKGLNSKVAFIASGMVSAACVEGFYMISSPVFGGLRVTPQTGLEDAAGFYLADLAFTMPAYAVILSMVWFFINRFEYAFWEYFLLFGLAQALGDGGGFFFLASPPMLAFLPYVMLNYHSINAIPYLLVRDGLNPRSRSGWRLIAPPVAIIVAYFLLGSVIKVAGYLAGFA
jgi:hypothetical protein